MMRKPKKHNYIYEINYPNGMKYVGVRSCDCEIAEDTYLGSAFHIPEDVKQQGVLTVLKTFKTRELADLAEIRLHSKLDVRNNSLYYNQCNANSTNFYPSEEAIKRGAEVRKGRTAETHEYVAKQVQTRSKYKGKGLTKTQLRAYADKEVIERGNIKRRQYTGANRTPAQKADDLAKLGIPLGPNPKKSNPGLKSGKVKGPWWYQEPGQPIMEVFDSVSRYLQQNPGKLPSSRGSISRYLQGTSQPGKHVKHWKFGYLINYK